MMATAGGWLGRGLHLGRASLATPGSGQARARRPPRSPRRRPPPSPPPACRVGPGTREAGATLRYARQAENTQGEQTADRKRSGLTSGPPGPPRSSSAPRLPVCYALPAGFHLNSFKGLDVLPEMSLVIRNLQRAIPIRRVPLRRNVEIVRNILGVEKFDLGIICLDNKNIQHINGIYRKKNVPTDVLSFPFHEDLKAGEIPQPGFPDDYNLGDIFLGVEYIFQQCKENEDYCDILTVTATHGLCHLLGFTHNSEAEWRKSLESHSEVCWKMAVREPDEPPSSQGFVTLHPPTHPLGHAPCSWL
ncbi:putative ribonuclease isoform X8 [Heterocephalus glaber]|uniref:Ribonuclease isoform X8 n=1 Tax=Heterocephalus glaber TaxID=10181 RepID=A0AAX6SQX2_HETGA|nr:putative ribonuclease isoform X8 [Heterocephalus glaber]XP_021112107.1 putative ribonuclease isoform X8 [Heterocephalus glaber]